MPYEGDPITDAMDILLLAVVGAAVYLIYELYNNPDSPISQGACNTIGIGCAPGVIPQSGLGNWAWQAGWWWGSASSAVDNANTAVQNAATSAGSAAAGLGDIIGSVVTGGTPTPTAPTPGLPVGYDPNTGQVGTTIGGGVTSTY